MQGGRELLNEDDERRRRRSAKSQITGKRNRERRETSMVGDYIWAFCFSCRTKDSQARDGIIGVLVTHRFSHCQC